MKSWVLWSENGELVAWVPIGREVAEKIAEECGYDLDEVEIDSNEQARMFSTVCRTRNMTI